MTTPIPSTQGLDATRGAELPRPHLHGGDRGLYRPFPLVSLEYLSLFNTEVVGDVKGLVPLVVAHLLYLGLVSTEVTGDAGALAPLVELTHLGMHNTGGWRAVSHSARRAGPSSRAATWRTGRETATATAHNQAQPVGPTRCLRRTMIVDSSG